MMIGDEVVADGMSGVIVCDFDQRLFMAGCEDMDASKMEAPGGMPSSGVMIKTIDAGLVHYAAGTWGIEYVRSQKA